MRYKTLYYNVEPISKKLPDDCLKLIIQYAYDESKYNEWFRTIPKIRLLGGTNNTLASFLGRYYEYYIYHVPKNTSPITSFEHFNFICISHRRSKHVYHKVYIPQLQIECDDYTFLKHYSCMLQLNDRIQKIELKDSIIWL